jgi:uncharacterized OsmC-like protein
MNASSHIRQSIESARDYLAEHPEQARYTDSTASAGEGVDREVLRELIEWAERYAPVSDALRRTVPMSVDVESASG